MSSRRLSLPSAQRLAVGVAGAMVVSLAFFPIYLAGARSAGVVSPPLHLYAAWELALPFWSAMIVPYLSMFFLFLLPPFQLDEAELVELAYRLVLASMIGGLILCCFPTEIGFAEHDDAGVWQPIYDFIYSTDGRGNAVPSFHVIYSSSILLAFIAAGTPAARVVYAGWLALVCASTVLTHRHQLLDVAGGLAVALMARASPPREFVRLFKSLNHPQAGGVL